MNIKLQEYEKERPLTIRRLTIENFRGVRNGEIDFLGNTLLVGGNNTGKSTICEALDLVLGPERLNRPPILNGHDFHAGKYLDENDDPVYIKIDVVLLHLPEDLETNLFSHTRLWSESRCGFIDGAVSADGEVYRALPLTFYGYYDKEEDDFVGNTFFTHRDGEVHNNTEEVGKPYTGLRKFSRKLKLELGFIYLRTMRTGQKALSLERGSLLDTIMRLENSDKVSILESAVRQFRNISTPIGEISQLRGIQDQLRGEVSNFAGLSNDNHSTGFFASDLTREQLRQVVQLFLKSQGSNYAVPFNKLGTGSENALVFSLLTHIAEQRDNRTNIFAMEEPEIALPPHAQRRIARYLLERMGQTIITSHSPYVIEEFKIEDVRAVLREDATLSLMSIPVDKLRYSTLRNNRRQLAEALLAHGVIVAEGETEVKMLLAASYVYERLDTSSGEINTDAVNEKVESTSKIVSLDLLGVSIFNAASQTNVPKWGPIFKSLNKISFAFHDMPSKNWSKDENNDLESYHENFQTQYKGTEELLVREVSVDVLKRFLQSAALLPDYPTKVKKIDESLSTDDIKKLAKEVLIASKGLGYAALVIEECQTIDEFPATIKKFLDIVAVAMEIP